MASTLHEAGEPTARRTSAFTLTDFLLLCMALIWGVNYAVVKFATGQFAPLAFNSLRVGIAAALLLAIVALTGDRLPRGRDLVVLLGLGALGNGLYQIFFIEGIARTRAGDAALLIAAAPALMAIIGKLRGTEDVGARGAAGIALSLAGMALVVLGGSAAAQDARAPLAGDLMILASALCWSVYSVYVKPYTERIAGLSLHAATMLGGAVPLLLVSIPALASMSWVHVSGGGWMALGYSALLALCVAYLFWYRGVRVLGPTRAAMYANLQPVIALGVAWAALDERPHLTQLAGAVLIMAGLVLTRLPSRHLDPPCE